MVFGLVWLPDPVVKSSVAEEPRVAPVCVSEEDSLDLAVFSHINSQGFPRSLRIRKSSEFTVLFKHPEQRLSCQGVRVLGRRNSLGISRLGLAIAKKHLSRAVDRNNIKRVVRESFRCHQHLFPGWDIVVVSRPDLSAKVSALRPALNILWQRLAACSD